MTLHISTGTLKFTTFWGFEKIDQISFNSSTTCMQKFDTNISRTEPPITILGRVEGLRLTDLTNSQREVYRHVISAVPEAGQDDPMNLAAAAVNGVKLEWTFTAKSADSSSPPVFGIRVKNLRFIYAHHKLMENVWYFDKYFGDQVSFFTITTYTYTDTDTQTHRHTPTMITN